MIASNRVMRLMSVGRFNAQSNLLRAECPRRISVSRKLRMRQFAAATTDTITSSVPEQAGSSKQLKLVISAANIPHPEKAATGGEDAFFVSDVGGGAFGVADGVGGWHESGVNPAEYSRSFMKTVEEYVDGTYGQEEPKDGKENWNVQIGWPGKNEEGDENNAESAVDLRAAFNAAHSSTRVPGSTTACALALDKQNNEIIGLNLGDSGFMILRRGAVLFKTPSMQHFFDCPCQFGCYPEFVESTDFARDAQQFNFKVQPGDVIVMGTDGLWDNCFDDQIVSLAPQCAEQSDTQCKRIAELAKTHSLDEEFDSPYILAAMEEGYDVEWYEKILGARFVDGRFECGRLRGGKMDDITVITAYVDEESAPQGAQKSKKSKKIQEISESKPEAVSKDTTEASPGTVDEANTV